MCPRTAPRIIFHSLLKAYKHFDVIITHQINVWRATDQAMVFCMTLHWISMISIFLYSGTKPSSPQLLRAHATSWEQDILSATSHAAEHRSNYSRHQGWERKAHSSHQAAISLIPQSLIAANADYFGKNIAPSLFSHRQFKTFLNQKQHHHLCV